MFDFKTVLIISLSAVDAGGANLSESYFKDRE